MKTQMLTSGTVIDHLPTGLGLKCLEILKRQNLSDATLIIFLNVSSEHLEKKDMIKIQNYNLDDETATYLSLIAPSVTINIIEDSKVIKKIHPSIPSSIIGIIKCINSRCITNTENYTPEYEVKISKPLMLKCKYCEFEFKPE
jgi:aspartate carbamoyltransferase regulatory subunit